MSTVDFLCVFVRASGERLLAAERLVLAFPRLFDALLECDVAYRTSARFLVVTLRFSPEGADGAARARLAFWVARAGGRASPLTGMAEKDRAAFLASFEACELKVKEVAPAGLFDATYRLFTDAGAPPQRSRGVLDLPILAMDAGGPGWEGVSYDPLTRALFVAAPMAPPVGDTIAVAVRTPSGSRPVLGRATVSLVRTPEQASPGRPAGYALEIAPTPAALHDALAAHAPDPAAADIRAAPRFPVNAPVKVIATPVEGPGADGAPRATIEYATGEELRADFIENLSQGGAFVRTDHPGEMGAFLGLELRLPNGVALLAQAVVVFVNAEGMGVRFTLDDEGEAILSSAIAQISGRPRRALVVDDDAFQRRVLSDALAERGFEVIAATDGAEGLRTLSEELLALDLLLTDVMMPGLDGEAFIRTIRKAGGELDLAIVAVTGRMEDGLEARLTDAGADAVLDKALGAELIAQAADAVLERKRLVLEPS